MAIKVTVNSVSGSRVSVNNQQRQVIRTVNVGGGGGGGATTLDQLIDINASDPDDNEVLVYDANTGTYIVQTLPIVNGGSF